MVPSAWALTTKLVPIPSTTVKSVGLPPLVAAVTLSVTVICVSESLVALTSWGFKNKVVVFTLATDIGPAPLCPAINAFPWPSSAVATGINEPPVGARME